MIRSIFGIFFVLNVAMLLALVVAFVVGIYAPSLEGQAFLLLSFVVGLLGYRYATAMDRRITAGPARITLLISRMPAWLRHILSLLFATVSSYFIGLVFDAVMEYFFSGPRFPAVPPPLMWTSLWSCLGVATLEFARALALGRLTLLLPFSVNFVIAAFASIPNAWNAVTALCLLLVTVLLWRSSRRPYSDGRYYLGEGVSMARGLREFTDAEYATFAASGWVKVTPDERIYKGPIVSFNRARWKLTVGTTKNRVFKIFLQHVARDSAGSARLFERTKELFSNKQGPATQYAPPPKRCIWDAADHNVVLELHELLGERVINLFLTANWRDLR